MTERKGIPPSAATDLLAFADWVSETGEGESVRETADPESLYVTFSLDEDEYGVPVEGVREILRVGEIRSVPRAPSQIRGVMDVRGTVLPVVEIRRCLGLEPLVPTPAARIVVVEVGGRALGLLVDGARGLVNVRASQREPPGERAGGRATCLSGMVRSETGLLGLVDPEKIAKGVGS